MIKYSDSVFIVIGANGLIGQEIVNIMLSKKNKVISIDLGVKQNLDDNVLGLTFDVSNYHNFKELLERQLSKYQILGVVNCSYPRTSDWGNSLSEISSVSFAKNLDIHLNSYSWIAKVLGDFFSKKKQRVSIVNYSSIYGFLGPNPLLYKDLNMGVPFPYSAIKAGIINITRHLASEYGYMGIRYNCISPGGVFDNQNQIFVERYSNHTPLGRLATPYEVAAPALFLLSDESRYITGHNLVIDGGYSIR